MSSLRYTAGASKPPVLIRSAATIAAATAMFRKNHCSYHCYCHVYHCSYHCIPVHYTPTFRRIRQPTKRLREKRRLIPYASRYCDAPRHQLLPPKATASLPTVMPRSQLPSPSHLRVWQLLRLNCGKQQISLSGNAFVASRVFSCRPHTRDKTKNNNVCAHKS